MSRHLSIAHILIPILLLSIVLAGGACFGGAKVAALLSGLLPGKFGPGLGPDMTGNHLFMALILFLDALLFHVFGLGALLRASRSTLLIGPDRLARLLNKMAGLSQEDIAATGFAVAEEQKNEIGFLRAGRHLVWIGAALLLLAFPAVCFTFAHANAGALPLLTASGAAIANDALAVKDAALFTADQLAGALLLDIPAIYKWHATAIAPNDAWAGLRIFILLFHILVKLALVASLFALWRASSLRGYVLRMAGPEKEMSAPGTLALNASDMHHEPVADTGHHEHGHEEAHGHDGHSANGHAEDAHAAVAHGEEAAHDTHDAEEAHAAPHGEPEHDASHGHAPSDHGHAQEHAH